MSAGKSASHPIVARVLDPRAIEQGHIAVRGKDAARKAVDVLDVGAHVARRDSAKRDLKSDISKRDISKLDMTGARPAHSGFNLHKPEGSDRDKAGRKPVGIETAAREATLSAKGESHLSDEALIARRRVRDKGGAEDLPDDGSAITAGLAMAAKASAAAGPTSRANVTRGGAREEPSDDKKVERHGSEPKLSVLDLRRSVESRNLASAKAAKDEAPKAAAVEAKAAVHDSGREVYRELSLGARSSGEAGSAIANAKTEGGQPLDFRSMLAERLRDAWNGEIVQSARVVLRDGDAGTIRLRLKPESLGNVKIELKLAENNISGRILVESDAAKSAFERNMGQLSDAFRQGGFDSARLEVAVGGGTGGGSEDSRRGETGGPFFSERLRGVVGSTADLATSASAYARRGGAVDILA